MELKHKLQLYIQAQTADAAPPLGTVLGNLGVNTVNFCKEFNYETADLPNYLTVPVKISVFSNRSYKFTVCKPTLGSLLNLVSYEKTSYRQGKEFKERVITLKTVIQLALWTFPWLRIEDSLPSLLGVIKAANLKIDKIPNNKSIPSKTTI